MTLLITYSTPASTLSLATLDSATGTLNGTSLASFYSLGRDLAKGMESCTDMEAVVSVDEDATCVAASLGGGVAVVAVGIGRDRKGRLRLEEGEFVVDLRQLANLWMEEEAEGKKPKAGRPGQDNQERKVRRRPRPPDPRPRVQRRTRHEHVLDPQHTRPDPTTTTTLLARRSLSASASRAPQTCRPASETWWA